MKLLKRILKIIGLLTLLVALFIGAKVGFKFYDNHRNIESLNNTILGLEINQSDLEEAKSLKQGQILSKKLIDLSTIEPLWSKFTENEKLKSEFHYLGNINFYAITYKSDSLLINGLIAEPKQEGKFPLIIFNRGGNKEVGKGSKLKTLFSLIYSSAKLVQEGYVIVASCYRESDEFGGRDLNDVLNLTKTAKYLKNVDSKRIGMFGWSRGGMMTYLSLKNSNQIKTAVIGNGPTDLSKLIIERPEMETEVCAKLIPNYQENKKEELDKRSVINWVNELDRNASLLILCGTEDKRVNPNQAEEIAKKLAEINYDFELKRFKTDHKFSGKTNELNTLLVKWFKERL